MFRVAFYPVFGSYLLVVILLGLILAAIVLLPPRGQRLPKNGRRWLLGFRLAALVLLALVLFKTTVIFTETRKLAATILLMVDRSESMAVPDEIGGKTRFEAAKMALEEAAPVMHSLAERCEIKAYSFDKEIHPLEILDGNVVLDSRPNGSETAIGSSLEQVLVSSTGKRVLATVLLSDGTQRSRPPRDMLPQDAAIRYRDGNQPIYAVRFGNPGASDTQDVAVRDMNLNEHVFVNNELTVSGQVRISGYVNQAIPLKLFFETAPGIMSEVASKDISVMEDGQLVSYRFVYTPEKPGLYKVTVSVPAQAKELITTNNEISTFVRVLDGGLKVLYIEGTRRDEQRFIRSALSSSPDIHVDYERIDTDSILMKSPGAKSMKEILVEETARRKSLIDDDFRAGKYLVYIIGDIDSDAFKREELEELKNRVEQQGAGIMFLGGLHAYGAGGFASTPISSLYPVQLSNTERQPFGGTIRKDVHIEGPLKVRLSELGKASFLLRFSSDPRKNEEIWNNLPALDGANRLSSPRGGAMVLLQSPGGDPLLVTQTRGSGRVLASALDTTWNWRLRGHEAEHTRFWRQAILWLAKMDDSLSGDCWITLDKKRYLPGETVKFKVHLQDASGEQVRSPVATAAISLPDGREESVTLLDEDGTMSGTFRMTEQVGDYTIRATARPQAGTGNNGGAGTGSENVPGRTAVDETKQGTNRFLVLEQNIELDNPIADPRVLESISNMTGGKTVAPEQLGSLLKEIAAEASELTEKRETKKSLYDSWPVLMIFVALMSIEWFLRKHWGLV